jgi:hypothetical protein
MTGSCCAAKLMNNVVQVREELKGSGSSTDTVIDPMPDIMNLVIVDTDSREKGSDKLVPAKQSSLSIEGMTPEPMRSGCCCGPAIAQPSEAQVGTETKVDCCQDSKPNIGRGELVQNDSGINDGISPSEEACCGKNSIKGTVSTDPLY